MLDRRWVSFSFSLGIGLASALAPAARADVEMPAVFGSGMVLQREMPVPVWGWADPGEGVRVAFQGQTLQTVADAEGRWRVTLEPLQTRKKGATLEVRGRNRLRFRNVRVGEVWVASGQSNMAFALRRAEKPRKRPGRLPRPDRIRLLTIPRRAMNAPQADAEAVWVGGDDPKARRNFSAVAWYFGQEIAAEVGVPVGLIHTSWGGTAILPWTPAETPPPATRGAGREGKRTEAAALYNGMVAPLVPFAIRGVIWYQGESDSGRAALYCDAFPRMIAAWRKAWGQGDFPFYFVQLANYGKRPETPGPSPWAHLREAQFLTLRRVPRTGMAVTIDIGNADDIHPRNKQDVGLRLARWALAQDYGEKLEPSGPLYRSHEIGDGDIVLHFDHVAKKLEPARGRKIVGFELAGDDGVFRWAEARIDGDTVVVSHPSIAAPVAARYAWANDPACNLQNSEGLPASPFRTDPDGTVVHLELGRRLDEAIRDLRSPPFWGSILVAKDGEILLAKGYGMADYQDVPNTPLTLFELGSASEPFTAAAVFHLQKEGKLRVTDGIGRHLEGVPPDKTAITIHHLLTHTSGLSGELGVPIASSIGRAAYVKQILATPLETGPGTRAQTQDVAYALLAAIVETVSGDSFEAYCAEHVFRPAKLEDTGFLNEARLIATGRASRRRTPEPGTWTAARWHWGWGYRGRGGVVTTVRDLYRWDRALRGGERIPDGASKARHAGGVAGYAANVVRVLDEDCFYGILSNDGRSTAAAGRAIERLLFPR